MRLASFNLENLFDRAKAFDLSSSARYFMTGRGRAGAVLPARRDAVDSEPARAAQPHINLS
jgi:hypothetical protein